MARKLYEYLSPQNAGLTLVESKDGKDLYMQIKMAGFILAKRLNVQWKM